MASTDKPTILLVHGAWHVPESYQKLTNALRAAGFEVHAPRNPSMNQSRPPNADLYTDSDQVRSYATSLVEAGRTVAVLMHSYGGQVGTEALYGLGRKAREGEGKAGGISHLIYMTAFALPEGKRTFDMAVEFGDVDLMPATIAFDEDQSCVPNYPKEGFVGEGYLDGLGPGELEGFLATVGRWNGRSMYQPVRNTAAWRDEVKVSYIHATGDVSIPMACQEAMVGVMEREGKKKIETVELESGHSPFLTATDGVVSAVVRLTSE